MVGKGVYFCMSTSLVSNLNDKYQFKGKGGNSFSFNVQPDDMDIWTKLWNTAPPKKGETEGETKEEEDDLEIPAFLRRQKN